MTSLPINDDLLEEWLRGPTSESLQDCTLGFYEWFCELEGYHIREERFWDDVERQDTEELLRWLKTAYRMGYERARR